MAAGIYSANGDMQVMNSNAHQYSLQHPHHAQQQRGAPQSTAAAPSSYPTTTTSAPPQLSNNGPAHYHHGQQTVQPNGGYNINNNTVLNGTDRSRPRGGEEDEQHHRRRRSRSNNRRNTSTTTAADRRQHNGNGGESCPLSDNPIPQGAAAGASHQFHYPAGVGVSNNVTPPSQDTNSGSAHPLANQQHINNNSSTNNNSAQAALDAAQRRPSYLLHRDLVIGKGSYGQVCIASRGEAEGHHSTSRSGKRKKFACKCVMLRNDPKYIAKLQEEVNVLRELRGHDNVIRLFDVFCVDNELFIITELGRGGDLFHLLTTHPKHGVTEAYAAKTVAEMLSAVSFLHSRHICHRDLKLENWVLESGKDVWSPLKLIDFGLSTHYTPGHRLSRVVGSSYYVAPEVLKKSYTEACDLWSLGVIVYMLLSGAPPFYGRNDEAIKASIVNGQYQFPHELFRDVTDDAMAFVSCLLSYSIEYRYTAEQALTHPWLRSNCDPEMLQRAKDGVRGVVSVSDGYDINAMQM